MKLQLKEVERLEIEVEEYNDAGMTTGRQAEISLADGRLTGCNYYGLAGSGKYTLSDWNFLRELADLISVTAKRMRDERTGEES